MKTLKFILLLALLALIALCLVSAAIDIDELFDKTLKNVTALVSYSLPINIGVLALFSALEYMVPSAGPRKIAKARVLNIKITAVNFAAATVFSAMIGMLIAQVGNRWGLGLIDLRFSTGGGIASFLFGYFLSLLIFDFFFYWTHRFQHESTFLWQEHKLHHLDEQLCALTSFRQNWLDGLVAGAAVTVPMALLFKLDPSQGGISAFLTPAWGVFIHMNVRLHLGWASALIGNPQVHRIHHSREDVHLDKNYAAFFPILDILFGTYYHPKKDEYPLTGVHAEREVDGLKHAELLPFYGWKKVTSESFCSVRDVFNNWLEQRRA